MFTRHSHATNTMRLTLEPPCTRQELAELRWDGPGEGAVLRIRFQAVKGDDLHVQLSPSMDATRAPAVGHSVTVSLSLDGQRCRFSTRVRKVLTTIGPGGRPRTATLVLLLPEVIHRQQRRAAFRIPLGTQGNIEVTVCPAAADEWDCCAIGARPMKGPIVNLSTGGLGVVLRMERIGELRVAQKVFVDFVLPEVNQEFVLRAEVRSVRAVRQGGGVLVGVRFLFGLSCPLESLVETITQFVTREERRRLRRKR
jgi:hypothetical protein